MAAIDITDGETFVIPAPAQGAVADDWYVFDVDGGDAWWIEASERVEFKVTYDGSIPDASTPNGYNVPENSQVQLIDGGSGEVIYRPCNISGLITSDTTITFHSGLKYGSPVRHVVVFGDEAATSAPIDPWQASVDYYVATVDEDQSDIWVWFESANGQAIIYADGDVRPIWASSLQISDAGTAGVAFKVASALSKGAVMSFCVYNEDYEEDQSAGVVLRFGTSEDEAKNGKQDPSPPVDGDPSLQESWKLRVSSDIPALYDDGAFILNNSYGSFMACVVRLTNAKLIIDYEQTNETPVPIYLNVFGAGADGASSFFIDSIPTNPSGQLEVLLPPLVTPITEDIQSASPDAVGTLAVNGLYISLSTTPNANSSTATSLLFDYALGSPQGTQSPVVRLKIRRTTVESAFWTDFVGCQEN